ncbi:MAG: cytochrome c oxidase accessory protein CcoG [Verrucomicrobiota bacterium]
MSRNRQRPTRDSVTTIAQDGSRNFLHPADVRGVFTFWRRFSAIFLILIYVSLPWIPVNGFPAVFLDLAERRFHLFGLTLAAEDLWILFFFVTGLGFLLFFVTALFGRLWCGWACPQTVFLEHVFRRIERWIEGPARKQKELDRMEWCPEKVVKRGAKHAIFILLAGAIAHIFLSYFISLDALFSWMSEGPGAHPRAFVFILFVTGVLYFNFSWFREQLCLIICPYGRLQSALIDDDTVVIGYDETRGEPRGRKKARREAGIEDMVGAQGDCIDCFRCVEVCPTGIDIRQGLQMECIGCSNCIDACDDVMEKIGRPKGLVRYDSLNGLAGKTKKFIRPRLFLYFALMSFGIAAFGISVTKLKPGNLGVSRMTGSPFFVSEESIRNQFNVRLINKRNQPVTFSVSALSSNDELTTAGFDGEVVLPAMGETVRPFVLTVPKAEYEGPFPVTIEIHGNPGDFTVARGIEFLGPDPRLLRDDFEPVFGE